jgi:hypothetical protein
VKKEFGDLPDECRRYFIIRTIIDMQITTSSKTASGSSTKPACNPPMTCGCCPSRSRLQPQTPRTELRTAPIPLQKSLLQSRRASAEPRAVKMLGELFNYYLKHPKEIGEQARRKRVKAKSACTAPFAITSPA